MEQLWNYLSHVCPIFCKFHKNHSFCWGPLNLLFHGFTLFSKFLNFAEIFQFFFQFAVSTKITNLVTAFSLMQWIFKFFYNFCNCMQTWTYLFYYYCVSLFIGKAASMESTWWSALQIVTSKCQACACESKRSEVLFKRWIHNHYSLD